MSIPLKYGCNPHQVPATLQAATDRMPLRILNGMPGYINILDALGAWQLVHELSQATGLPSAASFKHTSPAGAAIASAALSEAFRSAHIMPDMTLSPVAIAYARARAGDRVCSYGDAVAVSHEVDESLARLLDREVSDLIIAPAYTPIAMDILKHKKKGGYLILQIDPEYEPPGMETREIFGLALQQRRNTAAITRDTFGRMLTPGGPIPEGVLQTLIVGTIALKYTQSNSVCVAYDGQVIGMGAGQQSRIHCTRLACDKADKWLLQLHPRIREAQFYQGAKRVDKFNLIDQYLSWEQLSDTEAQAMRAGFHTPPPPLTSPERHDWIHTFQGLCLCSDAFIPFRDNIDRASRTNVQYVAQTGGGLRDVEVTAAAQQYGMTMIHTGVRLFAH